MSTTQIALTAHLVMPKGSNDKFIKELNKDLENKFNIVHTTFQIERQNLQRLEEC
ncbi:MAG TPA: hypothetical protein VFD91_10665 [Mariniphaga sp.]|nr:hypothetical protein [Mariniphaga sp.]